MNATTLATQAEHLVQLLKLRCHSFGMKLFERVADMQAVPRIRRPDGRVHTLDQIVAQAARLGFTVGITADDLVGDQCRAVVGLARQDEAWRSGAPMVGVWYATPADAHAHQQAMTVVPAGRYEALAVSPLSAGRLEAPDIALFYATPGAMMYFINGLQWAGYERFDWSVVGESACADSWGRALATGEPSLSIPCFAERRYGGVMEDELLMAIPPSFLPKVIDGLRALARNGLRYPIPPYGVNADARAGLGVSYG